MTKSAFLGQNSVGGGTSKFFRYWGDPPQSPPTRGNPAMYKFGKQTQKFIKNMKSFFLIQSFFSFEHEIQINYEYSNKLDFEIQFFICLNLKT